MSNKKYWRSLEDLNDSPELIKKAQNEFAEPIPMDEFLGSEGVSTNSTPRRDFLKFLGFSVTAATLAACETPVRKVVPYVIKPEEITVGVSNWYATTFANGHDYCEVLVKTREGRPIKIEGNKFSKVTGGGTNARTQASVLSLYDEARFKKPMKGNAETSWSTLDKEVVSQLSQIASAGGQVRLLTSTITSPSTRQVIAEFTAKYPTAKHITYDAISFHGVRLANMSSFGKAVIPTYHFEKSEVIVSFGADFLNAWLSPIEYAKQYGSTRKLNEEKKSMSRHYQFETLMSVTGANADYRVGLKPSQLNNALVNLYNEIAKKSGSATLSSKASPADKEIVKAANDLWNAKGKSLVVSGSNDKDFQTICNAINAMLGSYGNTIDLENHSNFHQGNDEEVASLIQEMKEGKVGALFMNNVNPVYSMPSTWGFEAAMSKVALTVSFDDRPNETTEKCKYVATGTHFLESWGDASPKPAHFALIQPTIYPIFDARQMEQSLLMWSGSTTSYQDYVKSVWQKSVYTLQSDESNFETWWMTSLHDGVRVFSTAAAANVTFAGDLSTASSNLIKASTGGEFEVTFYENAIGDGSMSNNPWLHELPDAITKVVWDNYITMSPKQMIALGYSIEREQEAKSDVAEVVINGTSMKLPVYPQPGQPEGTIGIAMGYGRKVGGKLFVNKDVLDNNVLGGANIFPALTYTNGSLHYMNSSVTIKKTSDQYILASTQTHHTMMGRNMVKETNLLAWQKDKAAGNERETFKVKEHGKHVEKSAEELDLWATEKNPGFDRPGHFWNLSIDLNSCIGCGNCIVSCQAENNVSVVGKDEVRRTREMHWLRIDRYYSSDRAHSRKPEDGKIKMYHELEVPSENPEVVFQPVMCQHCNHAPCETVCPVIATTHSSEGLNQMTYNRCVGTKYCANNCPYKVRRFNWFNYHNNAQFDYVTNNELSKLVLNPDVTVRSRGVMEKCSMCVQRIQEGKLSAKRDGRRLKDGDVETACAQSCPTNAITFGDANLKDSKVAVAKKDERMYTMLDELDTQPSVFYLTKVRNNETAGAHHEETSKPAHHEA
jgi:molybdopterin-containing oxidoreductase family iron-sulfur binding subunit